MQCFALHQEGTLAGTLGVWVSQSLSSLSLVILGAWFPVSWQLHGTKWWLEPQLLHPTFQAVRQKRARGQIKCQMLLIPLILLSTSPQVTWDFIFLAEAAPKCEGRKRNTVGQLSAGLGSTLHLMWKERQETDSQLVVACSPHICIWNLACLPSDKRQGPVGKQSKAVDVGQ